MSQTAPHRIRHMYVDDEIHYPGNYYSIIFKQIHAVSCVWILKLEAIIAPVAI